MNGDGSSMQSSSSCSILTAVCVIGRSGMLVGAEMVVGGLFIAEMFIVAVVEVVVVGTCTLD